jgi:surface antigen
MQHVTTPALPEAFGSHPLDATPRTWKLRAPAPIACALLAGLAATCPAAWSQGVRSAQDSPIAMFDDEDMRLMQGAIQQALDSGERVEWRNDKTRSRGTATPSPLTGENCRKLAVENRHKTKVGNTSFQFCKVDGSWKAVS